MIASVQTRAALPLSGGSGVAAGRFLPPAGCGTQCLCPAHLCIDQGSAERGGQLFALDAPHVGAVVLHVEFPVVFPAFGKAAKPLNHRKILQNNCGDISAPPLSGKVRRTAGTPIAPPLSGKVRRTAGTPL